MIWCHPWKSNAHMASAMISAAAPPTYGMNERRPARIPMGIANRTPTTAYPTE